MGAFDKHIKSEHPDLIPINKYDAIANVAMKHIKKLAKNVYIPPCNKLNGRVTTKDVDVFFVPNSKDWKTEVKSLLGDDLVTFESNGRQLMCVVKNVLNDGKQYFLDFIAIKSECFTWSSTFYNTSSLVPIVVGRFAGSLGYKITDTGLKTRIQDSSGNYHIVTLTKDPEEMFRILFLDAQMFNSIRDGRYLGVFTDEVAFAMWITQSPRFCYKSWNAFVPNNAHRHSRRKPSVVDCLTNIDNIAENCKDVEHYDNLDYALEEFVLGEDIMDDIMEDVELKRLKMLENNDVIDGRQIMDMLDIKGGAIVGRMKKIANDIKRNTPDISDTDLIVLLQKELNSLNESSIPKV